MKILYIRNHASKVNLDTYNLQEIGFSKELVNMGHDCDVIYYNYKNDVKIEEIYNNNYNKLNIIWMPAIKILDNGIYTKVLNKKFVNKYDIIITTEYTQIMTYFLTYLCREKLVLYQGPYKDQDKRFIHKIYDILFLNRIKKIKNIYCKSELCNEYLKLKKNIYHAKSLGVGLDTEKLENKLTLIDPEIESIKSKVKNKKVLLYIGRLEERRNIIFLLDLFKYILNNEKNICMIIIGDGKKEDKLRYLKHAKDLNIWDNIIYLKKISQSNIKNIYNISNIFILPTLYEIFGMVLLESMFFGIPAITSNNGGSSMLIENNNNGIIMNSFNVKEWGNIIIELLNNEKKYEKISKKARMKIINEFTWKNISKKFMDNLSMENNNV